MSLDRVEKTLIQARKLGLERLYLYSGEIAVYPNLPELLRLIVRHDFTFGLVTNRFRFEERLFPLLLEPFIQRKSMGVCFSIDGARAETHDVLRGTGSFAEVLNAIGLCILKKIPRALKTVITSYNKDELTELALLGAGWEVLDHAFLLTHPTPNLIRARAIPSPDEMVQICTEVKTLALRLDPLIALAVAANIIFTGYKLLVRSGRGLLDMSLPEDELKSVHSILGSYQSQGVGYHALRSRQAAARKFLVVHLLLPGEWTISAGHKLADQIENQVRDAIPNSNIVTHIEPANDPLSLQDASLDRAAEK